MNKWKKWMRFFVDRCGLFASDRPPCVVRERRFYPTPGERYFHPQFCNDHYVVRISHFRETEKHRQRMRNEFVFGSAGECAALCNRLNALLRRPVRDERLNT